MRGWGELFRTSVGLGLRYLFRHGYLREALARVVIPLDPSRYLELPWAMRELGARPGERVLDLASPKLLGLTLARRGVDVTSIDELASEIDIWQKLTAGQEGLRFQVADGRRLPFADASFDYACSISVLEHIAEPGDEEALRELARVTKPDGRVILTLPYSTEYREDWRESPAYVDHGSSAGRYFFQRHYDEPRLKRLAEAVPALRLELSQVVGMWPNWNAAYTRTFPWLMLLGPFYGLLGRETVGPEGDVVRLAFVRV